MSQHPRKKPKSNAFAGGITRPVCSNKRWICISEDKIQACKPGYNITNNTQLYVRDQFDTKYASIQIKDKPEDNDFLFGQPHASLVIEKQQQIRQLLFENSLAKSRTVKPAPGLVENSNSNTLEIFLSYAKKDEELFNRFNVHLEVLQRQFQREYRQQMFFWDPLHDIIAGQDWKQTIEQHLTTAKIILLLVSIDFLNSDFCCKVEMTKAIMRHYTNDARVIPVILRTCRWEKEAFGQLQPLPNNGKPVNKWHDRDEAFLNIYDGIWTAIEELLTQNCNS
jgi:TIR domain